MKTRLKPIYFSMSADTCPICLRSQPLRAGSDNRVSLCRIIEIKEAGKCLALRGTQHEFFTACASSNRICALAGQFNVPVGHKTWNELIEQIEKAIKDTKKAKVKPANWKDDQQFYSEAASQFMHFKNAWRNTPPIFTSNTLRTKQSRSIARPYAIL